MGGEGEGEEDAQGARARGEGEEPGHKIASFLIYN